MALDSFPNEIRYSLEDAVMWLERTPVVLRSLLSGIPDQWANCNEGDNTWSAFDVMGHLIHGEHTDWIQRISVILNSNPGAPGKFKPFDRFAQFEESKGKTLENLLSEFERLRKDNLQRIRSLNISEDMMDMEGIHPDFGLVKLSQLLSTWVVHDFNHLSQISRVLAGQYSSQTGPWKQYLRILNN